MITIPPYLKKGDTIGIVCPAGFMPYEKINTCIKVLQEWGYHVQTGITIGGTQENYFAASDAVRLQDLQQMLDDKNIKAILCARGGYGLSRIIDQINFNNFKKNPTWIIGFSDITVLHAHINRKCKIATLHAPMAGAFNNEGYKNQFIQSLQKALQGKKANYSCTTHPFNKPGIATAELVGGNLAIMAHLIGSASAYTTKDKILFIEDVGEYLYNIDRMFIQLKRAGVLKQLKGLIIGGFTDLKDTTAPFGKDVYSIIQHHLQDVNYPICFNFPVSHATENYALKVGATYQLHISPKVVRLKEL